MVQDAYRYEIHDDFKDSGNGPPDCVIICRPTTDWNAWAETPEPLQESETERAFVKVHRGQLLAIPLYKSTMVEGAFDTSAEEIIEGLPVIHTVPHAANDLCIILSIAYNDINKMDHLDTLNCFQLWQLWQACNYYQMYVLRHSVSMLLRPSLSDMEGRQAIEIHCAARDLHDAKLAAAAFQKLSKTALPRLIETGLLRHLDDAHLNALITHHLRDVVTDLEKIKAELATLSRQIHPYGTQSLSTATTGLKELADRIRPL